MEEHYNRRNDAIREDFQRIKKAQLRSSQIIEQLATKFFLSPVTIENIVFFKGQYKPKKDELSESETD
jgi:hypothetical protein